MAVIPNAVTASVIIILFIPAIVFLFLCTLDAIRTFKSCSWITFFSLFPYKIIFLQGEKRVIMKKLPSEFIQQMEDLLGAPEAGCLVEALQQDPPTSIRLNPLKPVAPSDDSLYINKVSWCEEGRYLSERPPFTFDPLFHVGSYYVQEASSMFLHQVVRQYVHEPMFALDLCAAPGGKSTLLRAVLPDGSILVSNEIVRQRAQVLAENMIKWGHPEVLVTNNAPADFAPCENLFDFILADVPCSGEGMFRKDDEAIACWTPDNVQMCAERQRGIVADVWNALRPGGLFIYSTCTYNAEEDEHNVAWIVQEFGAEVLPVKVPEGADVVGNRVGDEYPVYHFYQHKVAGEGFFLAVLRKPSETGYRPFHMPDISSFEKEMKKKNKRKSALPVRDILKVTQPWVLCPESYYWWVSEEGVSALPLSIAAFYFWAQKYGLKMLEVGIQVATLKGADPVPDHHLAMSAAFNAAAFAQHEVNYAQAVAYLRKEAITLSPNTPKGYVLLVYRNQPLGFVKNLGLRANNLYPQEWRIRSSYIPAEFSVV
jgi:16S rRNA C967 or C1407 C5-methylase (RsmB/RsmF family)/NOL1/NOP2/fmu family ribosome biogenesis protein